MENDYVSSSQAATILGISRVAVFKKIKKGDIEALKVGRNYIIDRNSLGDIYRDMTANDKGKIDSAFVRVLREYDSVLKRLGTE